MKKEFLIGLGAVGATAFMVSKKLTEEQKDKILNTVDGWILNGKQTALKYDRYAQQYLDDNGDKFKLDSVKSIISKKVRDYRDNSKFNEALSSLKSSTSNIKQYLSDVHDELEDTDVYNSDDADEDIVIDSRSAFSEAKEEPAGPTLVFYPDGTFETK